MRTPARVSISSARRGSVQFGRSATGPDRTSSATARARSALTGAGPGATDVFSASMPPVMKALRQKRTVSSRTPKASAIWPLVQPDRVSKIARARSASPRSRERLRAISARSLFFVCRNRGFARHDPNLRSDQTTESQPASVGQPGHTCLAAQVQQLEGQVDRQGEVARVGLSMEEFCRRVREGLDQATWEQKRQLIEWLVVRVIVTDGEVEIRYAIPTSPAGEGTRFCQLRADYRAALGSAQGVARDCDPL